MKKWICLLPAVCLLTGCSAMFPSKEPVQQLSGNVVSGIESTAYASSTPSETKPITITTVKRDGTVDTAQVSAGTDQYELLMQVYTEGQLVSYPKLEQQPDGTFEIVTVEMSIPSNPQQSAAYSSVIRTSDGILRVITMGSDGRPVSQQKTATKTSRFYSADGTLQWTMSVTASFTYDGLSVTCSDISTAVTIENQDSWCIKKKTVSESSPSLDVTFGRIILGVITSTPEFSLVLECDNFGNLS